ncbi:MAG TPA: prepilin-type N-terminal cleavage/methylation domain-containing protein, partial [Candidatus Saccharimonadales bacterium]|nr:prepilin-type N-terminal cleavage/methylation domain-containing protein [Candidatus Saccharimonadales bacterium]
MKALTKINQAGDTIIEVMIVLAILSMSFGISYATANKSLNGSLNAQEHSAALGILDTQLEDLRIALTAHPAG